MNAPAGALVAHREEHLVKFYDGEGELLERVRHFVHAGLEDGAACVVIATAEHAAPLKILTAAGPGARERLVILDARQTLLEFMVRGEPDEERFRQVIGGVLSAAGRLGNGQVRAFGEMVALLMAEGKPDAAIRLEQLWNGLSKTHAFSLLCAYPMNAFSDGESGGNFLRVCAEHGHVHPVTGFTLPSGTDELRRLVARLQQQTNALQAELARRRTAEASLRQRERELEELNARKDEFLAILGHELRNPMSSIGNAVAIMRSGKSDPEVMELARQVIERQFDHLTRLVNDLLDVSRVTTGKLALSISQVALSEVVDRAVEQTRPLMTGKNQQLRTALPRRPERVFADATRLIQALANLLNNAAKYTPAGGEISLHVSAESESVVFRVRDNGSGLPPEMKDRLFGLFTQGSNAALHGGGLGVGLSLAHHIVRLHGGSLQAHSDGPGRGSEFTITLPAASRPRLA